MTGCVRDDGPGYLGLQLGLVERCDLVPSGTDTTAGVYNLTLTGTDSVNSTITASSAPIMVTVTSTSTTTTTASAVAAIK